RDRAIQQTHPHMLALTRPQPVIQRRQHRKRTIHTPHHIRNRKPHRSRTTIRRHINRAEPTHRLRQHILTRLTRIRTIRPITRRRRVHHRRIQRRTIGITKPQPVHHPRPEILIHHITHRHQPPHHLPTTIRLQIHRHTLLITVHREVGGVVEGAAVIGIVSVPGVGTAVRGTHLAAFQFDDFGAEVGQHLGGVRALDALGEIQHPDAGEHAGHGRPPDPPPGSPCRETYRTSVMAATAAAGPSRVLPESPIPPYGCWSSRTVGTSLTITPPKFSSRAARRAVVTSGVNTPA